MKRQKAKCAAEYADRGAGSVNHNVSYSSPRQHHNDFGDVEYAVDGSSHENSGYDEQLVDKHYLKLRHRHDSDGNWTYLQRENGHGLEDDRDYPCTSASLHEILSEADTSSKHSASSRTTKRKTRSVNSVSLNLRSTAQTQDWVSLVPHVPNRATTGLGLQHLLRQESPNGFMDFPLSFGNG